MAGIPKVMPLDGERLHHGDYVCGVFGSCQNQINRTGGEIAKSSMTKDAKVVKNIKTSVSSFRDIHANGHFLS